MVEDSNWIAWIMKDGIKSNGDVDCTRINYESFIRPRESSSMNRFLESEIKTVFPNNRNRVKTV